MTLIRVLKIPESIGQNSKDIKELIYLYKDIFSDNHHDFYMLDFSECIFLGPTAVIVIAGIIRESEYHKKKIKISWGSIKKSVLANLCQNGFAERFGYKQQPWIGNSVPFREDKNPDFPSISDYLTKSWLNKNWVNIEDELKDAIACRVWEIYINAFDHAHSKTGVFSCGQHFHKLEEVFLSVVDFGVGIPNKVREFFQHDKRSLQLKDSKCLQWAFRLGNTTRQEEGVPRGLGLDLLRDFINVNNGTLEIYSGHGYALVSENSLTFEDKKEFFPGTLVQFKLIRDGRLYHFQKEDL